MIELRWKKASDIHGPGVLCVGRDKHGGEMVVLQYREGEDVIDMQRGVKTEWADWQDVEITDE